jgi:hypothetical protein
MGEPCPGPRQPVHAAHTGPAPARGAKTPLKSPLAVPSGTAAVPVLPTDAAGAAGTGATLAEFEDYLRTINSRDGRPYEEKTIVSYVGPGKNLDAWMTGNGTGGDFTVHEAADIVKTLEAWPPGSGPASPVRSSTSSTAQEMNAPRINGGSASFTTHQPLISRVGVFMTGLAIVFAVLAVRARHLQVRKNPGSEALSQSQHDS